MTTQKHWACRVAAVALVAIVAFGAILAAKPTTAKADWVKYKGAYYYQYANGTWAKNTWVQYKGTWYYIGSDYKVATNSWVQYDGSWYYLGKDGKVVTDSWVNYKGSWYYVYESGEVVIDDFVWYNDACYYFGADGKLVIGSWINYWGSYCYAGSDGKLVTNKFFTYNNAWYYLNEYGWLVRDSSVLYNGTIYTFDVDGKLIGAEPAGEPVTIEPQVLLDSPDLKVTATGFMGYMVGDGPELYLTIENNTDNYYELRFENVCVNGWQLSTSYGVDADAGVTETFVWFDIDELKKCDITQVADIEFDLSVYDVDEEQVVYARDNVLIETSAAATYVQTYDESGVVILDQDGIKLVAKGLTEGEVGSKGFGLYISNESGHDIAINPEDTKVNGIEISAYSFGRCIPGKHAMSAVLVWGFDLEEAGITDIYQMVTRLKIFDNETYEELVTTPLITLNF